MQAQAQTESPYLRLLPEPLDERPTTALGGNDPDIVRAISDMKATIAAQRQQHVLYPTPERKMSLVDLSPIAAVDVMRRQLLRRRNWILGGSGVFVVALLVTLGLYVLSYDHTSEVSAAENTGPIQVVIAPTPDEQAEALVNETSSEVAEPANKPSEMVFEPEVVERPKRLEVERPKRDAVVRRPKRRSTRARGDQDTVEGVDVDDIISAATSPRSARRARKQSAGGVVDDILAAGMQ
jgi:hypothetical protein